MAQELKHFHADAILAYGTSTQFDEGKAFDSLNKHIAQLTTGEGYRVLSITALQMEGFHHPGLDRLVATEFAILCEKD